MVGGTIRPSEITRATFQPVAVLTLISFAIRVDINSRTSKLPLVKQSFIQSTTILDQTTPTMLSPLQKQTLIDRKSTPILIKLYQSTPTTL